MGCGKHLKQIFYAKAGGITFQNHKESTQDNGGAA